MINVVDIMRLQPDSEHPHGLPDNEFDALFTIDKPVIFAYHGYPWLIHRLTYSRANHDHFHVRGFKERGTTTTPFDMVMLNDLDRFHLVMDVIDRVDGLAGRAALLRQRMADARLAARRYTREHGEDDPQIAGWTWESSEREKPLSWGYPERVATVLSVNVARVRTNPDPHAMSNVTGIDKVAVTEPVMVRAPGPMHGGVGSGLVGDTIGNQKFHGGDDQAVYVYAREDLDAWEIQLQRTLNNGNFGENLTTSGVDVNAVRIGERWRVGTDGVVLEVSAPRTPCRTFQAFLNLSHWMKTFIQAGKPGAYLRVISPGKVRTGDAIAIDYRPDHDVTIGLVFRARFSEPELLPQLLVADALPAELKDFARRRVTANDGQASR